MIGLKRGTVSLREHDPAWREIFLQECERLEGILDEKAFPFEHVGSTAVEGLPAKPIIDIMVGVDSIVVARELIPVLERTGYEYRANGDRIDRILLVLGPPECRVVHLSLIVRNSQHWHDMILFRDALRQRLPLRQQYSALKQVLASQFANDREQYTARKSSFIQRVLASARS